MKDRIRVRLRGFDVRLIDDSARGIVQTVQKAGAKVSGPIPLPTRINKYTVLRSPHVHKKSREQFEMRTHKRLIDIIDHARCDGRAHEARASRRHRRRDQAVNARSAKADRANRAVAFNARS